MPIDEYSCQIYDEENSKNFIMSTVHLLIRLGFVQWFVFLRWPSSDKTLNGSLLYYYQRSDAEHCPQLVLTIMKQKDY